MLLVSFIIFPYDTCNFSVELALNQEKSVTWKKIAIVLFNDVDKNLNKDIKHIKIPEIQEYLAEC